MSQYDFGTIDPNSKSGTALATDLNSWRNALHSTHGGSSAPAYITAGMLWLDTTGANYELKLYDGAQSITVAIIDATNNVSRVAVDSAETSYITATTAAQIKFVVASIDTVTVRSTGLQFNIAAPTIVDTNNNELVSFTTTALAVNQLNVANAVTTANPVLSAVGADTNIGITLSPKGTGRTNINQLALDGTTITTTAAQLNFVTGVTSLIQGQIDAKAPLTSPALVTPTITGNIGLGGATYGSSGQVLTSGGTGANATWTTPSSITSLGGVTTTSGTSVTMSSLVLTTYDILYFVVAGVSTTAAASNLLLNGYVVMPLTATVATQAGNGVGMILLEGTTSRFMSMGNYTGATVAGSGGGGISGITTSSTSITFSTSAGSFDAGGINFYGAK